MITLASTYPQLSPVLVVLKLVHIQYSNCNGGPTANDLSICSVLTYNESESTVSTQCHQKYAFRSLDEILLNAQTKQWFTWIHNEINFINVAQYYIQVCVP